jgi:hypothetical protein
MESGMDLEFDREVSEALEYQARTTALINAVVAKDKKEREATKRKAAEEKRKEAAAMKVAKRQAGAPAAKKEAGRGQVQVRARAAAQPVPGLRRQRHLRARAQGLPPRELAVPEDRGGSSEGCG